LPQLAALCSFEVLSSREGLKGMEIAGRRAETEVIVARKGGITRVTSAAVRGRKR
jgi:hypothetical protein